MCQPSGADYAQGWTPPSQNLTYKDNFGITRPRTAQQLRLERQADFHNYIKQKQAERSRTPAPTTNSSSKIDPNSVNQDYLQDQMSLN